MQIMKTHSPIAQSLTLLLFTAFATAFVSNVDGQDLFKKNNNVDSKQSNSEKQSPSSSPFQDLFNKKKEPPTNQEGEDDNSVGKSTPGNQDPSQNQSPFDDPGGTPFDDDFDKRFEEDFARQQREAEAVAGCFGCGMCGMTGAMFLVPLLIMTIGVGVQIFMTVFVYNDAVKNNVENPGLWALVTFLTGVIGILIYFLAIRNQTTNKPMPPHQPYNPNQPPPYDPNQHPPQKPMQ